MVFIFLYSTEKVAKRLAKLSKFKISTASALAVSINSPGGLPVQSEIICNKIR
jgi:ClpP class serine protease